MRLERLSEKSSCWFNPAFSLYQSSFPVEERRDNEEQLRVLQKQDYHFDLIMECDSLIGVMLYWEIGNLIFLEHFTTRPELRGNGYGSKALELLKEKGKTILLEIEPPEDEITQRRYNFYKRNGFVMNPYHHIQAKYHLGDKDMELKVLSFPEVLEKDTYRSFYEYMTREIGIQPHSDPDVLVRQMQDGDDLTQVAKLIYETDPYVYPNWFDCIEDGIKVLREMIELPTVYSKKYITVAQASDGTIAGIVVARQTPFVEEEENLHLAFQRAGVPCDHRTAEVFAAYYAKMGSEEDGYYIANVAVDPAYRNRGIACAMLKQVMQNHAHCALECVIANPGAWRTYQRLGFNILCEYPGVHDIPCYKMERR